MLSAVGLVGLFGLPLADQSTEPAGNVPIPIGSPTDQSASHDIFANVHGWIAYGRPPGQGSARSNGGIWAVDPTGSGDPNDQIQLSPEWGEPLAWSNDGSKLLIRRGSCILCTDLFVLNADGTETRLTRNQRSYITGGSFTPDGSEVVYADAFSESEASAIYTVNSAGGEPRLIPSAGLQAFFNPVFSPDGTQIAYFEGAGDHSNTPWVMNADGSAVRTRLAYIELSHVDNLVWSPDGSRLAFSAAGADRGGGIWVVAADGSGLTKGEGAEGLPDRSVVPDGAHVFWSPDGSRISYQGCSPMFWESCGPGFVIANPDGTHRQTFRYGGSGPWNPLPPSASGGPMPTATVGGGGAAPLVPMLVALCVIGVLVVLVLLRRARARTQRN